MAQPEQGTLAVGDRRPVSSSVTKAFQLVELLADGPDGGATLADLSTQLRMPKSTTHRYLTTLVSLGLAERTGTDHFRLGTRIIELAGTYLAKSDLRAESRAILEELAAQTAETVHLAVPSGGEVVYIAKFESIHAIRMYSHIGARLPIVCTALGKAILAFLPEEQRAEILSQPFKARTPKTITHPPAMAKELESIRSKGFAIDDEENEVGVCCVGAPVFDYTSVVIAALSVSGPISRMNPERCVELGPPVRQAALRISQRMGFPT
ncbi:MAG: IclR family transcriptional regulator [Anaerolineales bacterium]|nr:IclR family transcriptional regulator [Anaerolineales bacterium]